MDIRPRLFWRHLLINTWDLEELRVPQVAQRVDAADQFVELEDRLARGVMG